MKFFDQIRAFLTKCGLSTKVFDPKSLGPLEREAYDQGFRAGRESDNPYPDGSVLWNAWRLGFKEEEALSLSTW